MSRYLGQCDQLRRVSKSNEEKWRAMIECAQPVSVEMFLMNVDLAPILDEDETPEEFIMIALESDPTTGTYLSWWGGERCWFLATAGFEFIFLAS